MADTTVSPNMNLPVPTVSEAPGPGWATNLDSCLSIIDAHTHISGSGVQITPEAINISSDLTMASNNLTNARSVRFASQSVALSGSSDLGCLFELGVDLYYRDGSGNVVRITQGGVVTGATGTITGLPSGTASASFAANTFTFQRSTSTPAAMSLGPTKISQAVSSGKGVTISANGAQAADYALTLPLALPSVQSTIISDTSGNLSFSGFASGTYAPTVTTGGSGSSQAANGLFFYTRIGNIVTVSGNLIGNSSTTPFRCFYFVSLPINPTSTFSNSTDVAGTVSDQGNIVIGSGQIQSATFASTGTNLVTVQVVYNISVTSAGCSVVFSYSCA